MTLILFPLIFAWPFSIASPFAALSIPTIFLHKCQIKSFKDINILIKVNFSVRKTSFLKKLLKKDVFEKNFKNLY